MKIDIALFLVIVLAISAVMAFMQVAEAQGSSYRYAIFVTHESIPVSVPMAVLPSTAPNSDKDREACERLVALANLGTQYDPELAAGHSFQCLNSDQGVTAMRELHEYFKERSKP